MDRYVDDPVGNLPAVSQRKVVAVGDQHGVVGDAAKCEGQGEQLRGALCRFQARRSNGGRVLHALGAVKGTPLNKLRLLRQVLQDLLFATPQNEGDHDCLDLFDTRFRELDGIL